MRPSIEILVHISAPSSAQDDARYRQQARGILDFEAIKRNTGETQTEEEDLSKIERIAAPQNETTIPSPAVRKSVPAISRLGTTPRIHVDRTPIHFERPKSAPTVVSKSSHITPYRRSLSDSWETPPSVIPDSQPSNATHKRSLPDRISSSPDPSTLSPSPKRQRLQLPSSSPVRPSASTVGQTLESPHFLSSRSSNSLPTPLQPSPSRSPPLPSPQSSITTLYIYPPPPPTTSLPFTTHTTPSLQILATRLPFTIHYQPFSITRNLRLLERGHWAIDLIGWDAILRKKCWDFLEQYLGQGNAGWGVWGERSLSSRSGKMGEVDTVRIYSWGEVVAHLYLVLYVASDRNIKGTGARWIDAGGNVVVQMT